MKKILAILSIFLTTLMYSQGGAFDTGEYFKFRIHYGIVNAGYATLEVKEAVKSGKKMHHVVGKGYTTGMTKFFFKVEDIYESYFDKNTVKPYQSVRDVYEGGYERNNESFFNHSNNTVKVKDYKHKTEKTYTVPDNVQDIVSTFYYLRNHPEVADLNVGQSINVDMFFDGEVMKFKLKFIGREKLSTKFGDIDTMIFRPYVQAGRVFKEEESLTVWISDDKNRLPLRIKAKLSVGSMKADLDEYKGLKHPLSAK